jgi:hypothetical protein
MAAFTRRQYAGAAVATTTTGAINASATTVGIAANTGWPSAAGVTFYVVIDPGTSVEEKCLATISGTTLTLTRGQDDTAAASHASGATVYPVFAANDADEANELVAKLTTKGDLLVTSGSALNRLAVGTNDQVLVADSAQTNGVKWGTVSATGLASDAVTTAKILDANVTEAKLASNAVATAKIADGAVTAAKLAATAAIQPTIMDAKGDLVSATAADTPARLAVGTNGQVLTADSAQSTGLKWATPVTAGVTAADSATVTTSESTTSGTFTDLSTVGPAVTITTGSSAIVTITADLGQNSGSGHVTIAGVAVSGATTIAATSNAVIQANGDLIDDPNTGTYSSTFKISGLTPGSNTFTMKYRSSAGGATSIYENRHITVFAI